MGLSGHRNGLTGGIGQLAFNCSLRTNSAWRKNPCAILVWGQQKETKGSRIPEDGQFEVTIIAGLFFANYSTIGKRAEF